MKGRQRGLAVNSYFELHHSVFSIRYFLLRSSLIDVMHPGAIIAPRAVALRRHLDLEHREVQPRSSHFCGRGGFVAGLFSFSMNSNTCWLSFAGTTRVFL